MNELNMKNKTLYRKIKKAGIAVCLCAVILCVSGCEMPGGGKHYQNTGFAMGTVISQNIYGGDEEMGNQVLDVIHQLEQKISWRLAGTEVAKVNAAAGTGQPVEVSGELIGWLEACQEVYEKSEGSLDVTVGPAARLWDIGGENPAIPKEEELAEALEKVDGSKISIEDKKVEFKTKGGQLDLGAVGKGIGCDEIYDYIVTNCPEIRGTFSVGGSVLIYGEKPTGQPWKIGIRDPRGEEGEYMGALNISLGEKSKMNVSTSGDYEKYFEEDGIRYHHILDPRTGAPAKSDVISVTILSESGFLSDALSTACFVAGREAGLALAELFDAHAVVITAEKEVYLTEGASEYFELIDKEYKVKE